MKSNIYVYIYTYETSFVSSASGKNKDMDWRGPTPERLPSPNLSLKDVACKNICLLRKFLQFIKVSLKFVFLSKKKIIISS